MPRNPDRLLLKQLAGRRAALAVRNKELHRLRWQAKKLEKEVEGLLRWKIGATAGISDILREGAKQIPAEEMGGKKGRADWWRGQVKAAKEILDTVKKYERIHRIERTTTAGGTPEV